MNKFQSILSVAVISFGLLASPAAAQWDTGTFDLVQDGKVVGHLYVPARDPSETLYLEHWVLLPGYVSPSPKSGTPADVEITAGPNAYENEAAFFAAVSFPEGARYVKTVSHDQGGVPCN